MSLTTRELRGYLKPLLKRKSFRFQQLNGLLGEDKKLSLSVAKAFASHEGSVEFLKSLRSAPDSLRDPIYHELDKIQSISSQNGAAQNARIILLNNIQSHLISNGVYAEFGRPSSVGLLLKRTLIEDMPVYFILNESHQSASLFCGRLTINPDGSNHMTIFVSGVLARVAEILDLWMCSPKNRSSTEEIFERKIVRTSKIELERWCNIQTLDPQDMTVQFAIYVISVRSSIERLRNLATLSNNGEEFLQRAVNMQLDSVIAHETAHREENRANGTLSVPKETKEILAYLLEAVYARPEDAFLSLLNRNFDFEKIMPRLVSDLRQKGIMALLEPSSYLAGWAKETIEEQFLKITRKRHDEAIDVDKIKVVQSTDYILDKDLPFIVKAIYNPSNYTPGSKR